MLQVMRPDAIQQLVGNNMSMNRAAIFPRIRIPPVLVLFGYRGRQLLSVQVRSPALAGSAAQKAEVVQLESTDSQAFVL